MSKGRKMGGVFYQKGENYQLALYSSTVEEILKSDAVKAEISGITRDIQSKLGDRYQTDVHDVGGRLVSSVYTEDKDAIQDNLDNNTMLKASGI